MVQVIFDNMPNTRRPIDRLLGLPLGIISLSFLLVFLLFTGIGRTTRTSGHLYLATGTVENELIDAENKLVMLPFNLSLVECNALTNQTQIKVDLLDEKPVVHRLDMGKPLQMGNWALSLTGCEAADKQKPARIRLEVVHDTWQTPVVLSILLSVVCILLLLWKGIWNEKKAQRNKWLYQWLIPLAIVAWAFFLLVNVLKPYFQTQELNPSLQSDWFIPHVGTYILSYTFLFAATFLSVQMLIRSKRDTSFDVAQLESIENLVHIGTGLFLAGLMMGAMWAKEAWGNYWTWDIKETWAFVTVSTCLVFIHLRTLRKTPNRGHVWLVVLAFIFLLITWKGVNYLPGSTNSPHTYSMSLKVD